jgi:hopanoid biosynthesis associated protein HpnK
VKRLIVTADDFGMAPEVNEAVILAHTRGVLTAASLMVSGEAAVQAVELARKHPTLRVGLHLVLVQGRPVLPRERIPGLVGRDGRFSDAVAWSGARYFLTPGIRRQLEAECAAQLERFLSFGLPLDHINAHTHLHIHPTILDIVIALARRGGAVPVRLPRQPLRSLPFGQAAMAAVMAPWVALTRARLRRAGLRFNDETFGLFETGAMTEEAWLRAIPRLGEGVTEIYAHPATATRGELARNMPRYRHAEELAALLSPRVRAALDAAGVERVGFCDL